MPTYNLTNHRGLQVVAPDPVDPPGDGGLAINNNFKQLGNWLTQQSTSEPLPSDDTIDGIPVAIGSRWFHTPSGTEFVCTDATPDSVVWSPVSNASLSDELYVHRIPAAPTSGGTVTLVSGTFDWDYAYGFVFQNAAGVFSPVYLFGSEDYFDGAHSGRISNMPSPPAGQTVWLVRIHWDSEYTWRVIADVTGLTVYDDVTPYGEGDALPTDQRQLRFDASAGATNLIEATTDGAPVFKVDASGYVYSGWVRPVSGSTLYLGTSGTSSQAGDLVATSVTRTHTSSSGTTLALRTTYNQTSGSASNTDLLIARTQTAVGSGVQRFFDCQVGGVSRFNVSNLGTVSTRSATSSNQAHLQMYDSIARQGVEFGLANDSGYFNVQYVTGSAKVTSTCEYGTATLQLYRGSTSGFTQLMFFTDGLARYQQLGHGHDGTNSDLCVMGNQGGANQMVWCDSSPFAVSTRSPASAMADADLRSQHVTMWTDETNHKLKFKVKYGNGTVKSGEVALS